MKIKISLWIFGVLGIFSALVSMVGVFFFSFAGAPAYISAGYFNGINSFHCFSNWVV